jgi:DNA polymerase III subunit alpha
MADKPFVHLHCHTDYSLLDGACEIGRLMDVVERERMPAVAMTDHGNLFGAVEFYTRAQAKGILPVIGCELYVTQQSCTVKTDTNRYNHLVVLCENQEGYRNLITLVTTGHLEGFYYKPRIDKDLLARHSKGLIAMSACLRGDINETLLADRFRDARKLAHEYQDIFGRDNFFLEAQDHELEQDKIVLPLLNRLSIETGIPLVATNDAHYLQHDDARAHEVMLCIQTGKTMSDPNRMRFRTPEFFVKSRAEMMQKFSEIEDALDRTWTIAERCRVNLDKVKEPFPRFDVPKEHSIDTYFEYIARQGFERRRPRLEALAAAGRLKHELQEYNERLDFEIKLIQKMKFSGYFLIVWDFIRFAKSRGIPVGPGRGSAAGSLVSYSMEITDIDPLHYGLLFERFLNPERVSLPDIDIDFCTNGRGEVIQYVTEKYGREQVAQIITFGTLGAKAALKDVGRVLDMTFGEVDRITKLVPLQPLNIKLKDAIEAEPGIAEAARTDSRVSEMLAIAQRLEGMARNASIHAAGVVIAPEPLKYLVPLYRTNKDEIVTQYDMSWLEKLGLLKMDFLGLTTLTIVHDALNLIEKTRGIRIHPEELPLNDEKTYREIFSRGLTDGVFQFESAGMKDILRRYVPARVEDLIALNALYRPGPMGMIDDFIDRKQGRKEVVYDLPEMKAILEETYGVMVYQEQVIQIANVLAGYSLGEGDLLRRAMGKKNAVEMRKQRERFLAGASERGFSAKKAEKIFDLMEKFAGYGFNKSHSAAYAYLAFITGYLKAHYPVEFMAALLTSETGKTEKIVKYINECRDLGIRILPPDVNTSDLDFTPVEGAIRFGLGAVKNVGPGAVESIVAVRRSRGPFQTLYDFCEHVDLGAVNKRVMESLIKSGAMDSLGGTRSQKFAAMEDCIEMGQRAWRDRESGQAGLFGELLGGPEEHAAPPLPRVPDWTLQEQLKGEKETIGFYVTGHPLDEYRLKVSEVATYDSNTLTDLDKGADVALAGLIVNMQRKRNREGKLWVQFQLEDWFGSTDVLVFPKAFESLEKDLTEDRAILIRGRALPEEGNTKVSAQEVIPLELLRVPFPSLISIRVRLGSNGNAGGAHKAAQLEELFRRKPGETSVYLKLEKPRDFTLLLEVNERVRPDKEFRSEIERICGPEALEVLAS